jgi:polyisoprenoid-binding protein YceI
MRVVRWSLFAALVLLGLIGVALPVVPQTIFFVGALLVIMPESRWVRRRYIQWRRRHPRFFHALERWRRGRREARQARKLARESAPAGRPGIEPPAVVVAAIAALLATQGGAACAAEGGAARYGIAPGADTTLVFKAYRDGWFSSLGHDHTLAGREFKGVVVFDPVRPEASSVTLTVATARLEVLDPGVGEDDKAEIAKTLKSEDVLDVSRFPEIRFASTAVRVTAREPGGKLGLELTGDLTLHGRTRSIRFAVALEPPRGEGPLRASGTIALDQSDFGMSPYGVGLGAVKVKDRVELDFVVTARPGT